MKSYATKWICLALLGSAVACGKKSDDDTQASSTTMATDDTSDPTKIAVAGTLILQSLRLDGEDVSHVVAVNTQTGATAVAEVSDDGTFELDLDKQQPWVLNYVDDSKTGADMIVSTFASDTLDTLNAGADSASLDMGEVDVSAVKAAMSTAADDFLASINMSASAAATVGAIDDVSLRYSNPDIDNNGTIDALEGKSYLIDFHNRFNAKTANGTLLGITDLKNTFYPDDVVFFYTGTGIFPQIPRSDLNDTAPSTYSWKFSVDMPTAGNGGNLCSGLGANATIAAGTSCELTYSNNVGADGDKYFTFNLETANLKAGDYTLAVGGKTYQWTNVAVSDFSAGEGFLALFIRMDVDTNNKLTGVSYQWKKKTASGFALATSEEVKLIVKSGDEGFGGYISLKYQGDESKGGLGVQVSVKAPEGSVVFADSLAADDGAVNVNGSVLTKDMVKAGVDFADFTTNPGVSYDDKLGMRFFF